MTWPGFARRPLQVPAAEGQGQRVPVVAPGSNLGERDEERGDPVAAEHAARPGEENPCHRAARALSGGPVALDVVALETTRHQVLPGRGFYVVVRLARGHPAGADKIQEFLT